MTANLTNHEGAWLTYLRGPLAGYSIAAVALNLPMPSLSRGGGFVLSCSYGIYLAHPLFLEGFEFIAGQLGHRAASYSLLAKVLVASLICAGCIMLTWFARINWIAAYLLLGEVVQRPRLTPSWPSNRVAPIRRTVLIAAGRIVELPKRFCRSFSSVLRQLPQVGLFPEVSSLLRE